MVAWLIPIFIAMGPTEGVASEVGRIPHPGLLDYEIRVAPRGDRLLVVGERVVTALALPSGRKLWSMKASNAEISPDGKLVATQTGTQLKLLDIRSGRTVQTFKNPRSRKPFATISENGKFLVCRYGKLQFACRSLPSGKLLWCAKVPQLQPDVDQSSNEPGAVSSVPEAMALNDGGAVVWFNEDRAGGLANGTWCASSFSKTGKVIATHPCDQFFEYLLRVNPCGLEVLATVACNPNEHFTRVFSIPSLKELNLQAGPGIDMLNGCWVYGPWLLAIESDGRLTAYSMGSQPKVVFQVRSPGGEAVEDSFDGRPKSAVSADGKTWVVEAGPGLSVRRLRWPEGS